MQATSSPSRQVHFGPIIFMGQLDFRAIPAEKIALTRSLILEHTDRYFRRSRMLRRWMAVLFQPSASELSVRCVCERAIAARRPDNMAASFIKHYRFASSGRVTVLQKAKWVDTEAAGFAYADFRPVHEGYSLLAAGIERNARQQDAAATVLNNTTTPPLPPQVPAAIAASSTGRGRAASTRPVAHQNENASRSAPRPPRSTHN